jgi:hypothetical protein
MNTEMENMITGIAIIALTVLMFITGSVGLRALLIHHGLL